MKNYFVIAFAVSLFLHSLLLFNFTEERDINRMAKINYAKNSGVVKIKLQFRKEKKITSRTSSELGGKKKLKKNEQKVKASKSESSNTNLGQNSELAKYLSLVRDRITASLYKSRVAKKLALTGTVVIDFKISFPSRVIDIEVVKSSGFKLLDNSAKFTVESVRNIPEIPEFHKEKPIPMTISLSYR